MLTTAGLIPQSDGADATTGQGGGTREVEKLRTLGPVPRRLWWVWPRPVCPHEDPLERNFW